MLPVDLIVCVNLPDRMDRRIHMEEEQAKHSLAITYIDGVRPPRGEHGLTAGQYGCHLGHKSALEYAYAQNVETVLILEDDVVFCEDLLARFTKFITTVPKHWDVLALGYTCHNGTKSVAPHIKITHNIIKLRECWAGHAYMLNKKGLKTLLTYYSKYVWVADWYLSRLMCPKHNVFGYYPCLAKQIETYSDIVNAMPSVGYVTNGVPTWQNLNSCFKEYE